MRLRDKKKGVRKIESILGVHSVYMGPPTFEYRVGDYVVDRDGNVTGERLEELKQKLADCGIDAEGMASAEYTVYGTTACKNLINMIHSKQYLLERVIGKRAFFIPDDGSEPVGIKVKEDMITITGFPDTENYRILANAMINAAEAARWISPDETIEENEKYYMRAWLVRIGLGGSQYKELRKNMLYNLNGNAAFRTKEIEARWKERWS